MKITEKQLKKIISESVNRVISEEMAAQQAPVQKTVTSQLLETAWYGLQDMRAALNQLYNKGAVQIDVLRDKQVNAAYIKMQNSLAKLGQIIKK